MDKISQRFFFPMGELIQKPKAKILLSFCRGKRCDANFRVPMQNDRHLSIGLLPFLHKINE